MVIIEYQWCNTKHECSTDSGCNTPVREYNLPEEQRASWISFFDWLKDTNEILDYYIK